MGSKKPKEAIVFLLDVGDNMKELVHDSGTTFLQSSKECISQIIQRKIFRNSADELGLVVFGCSKTDNKLADEGEYRNIAVITKKLVTADWELLSRVNEQKLHDFTSADWLDALVIAMQLLKDEMEEKIFTQHKIVIFSNFACPISDDQSEVIVSGLKNLEISLVVIGPDVGKSEYLPGKIKSPSQTNGEILISNIVEETQGVICSFEEATPELMYFQRKNIRPTPWNALFTISSKIKIPIRAFKKIAETVPMKWVTSSLDDRNASIVNEKAFVRYDHEKEVEVVLEKDGVIDAYQFGSTIVPFSDDDKKMMQYESGVKGLFLIGVTSRKNVDIHMLTGSGSYVVLAKQDDPVATTTLEAFIQAIYQRNCVGIARRIYRLNSAVRIGALFPVVTDEYRYLIFAELPFAEDEHVYKFPSLSYIEPTEEQTYLVDSIIENMDLDEAEGQPEKYDITRIYDYHEQFFLRCISYKALHPNEKIRDNISELFKPSLEPLPELLKSCEGDLKRIKSVFQFEEVPEKPKRRKMKMDEVSDTSAPKTSNLFQNCGKADASENKDDIDLLLSKGMSLIEAFQDTQKTIEDFIYLAPGQTSKLIPGMKSMRKHSITNGPNMYNEWIKNFKQMLCSKSYYTVWNDLITEKLGLITKLECANSGVTIEEAEEFSKVPAYDVDSLYGTENTDDLWDEI